MLATINIPLKCVCGARPQIKIARTERGKLSFFVLCKCGAHSGNFATAKMAADAWKAAQKG